MDLRRTNKTLAQLMPMIMQREMQKLFLRNKIKGYEAWGEEQRGLQQSGMNKDILMMILDSLAKGTEESDRPGLQFLERLPQLGISPETVPGLELPTATTTYAEAMDPIQEVAKEVQRMYKEVDFTTAESIAEIVFQKGTKFTKKLIEDVAKMKKEQGELDVRERELTEAGERRDLGERELGVRRGELTLEKKGGPKLSKLETRLNSLRDRRWTISNKMQDIDYRADSKARRSLEKNVLQLNEDIKKLKKQLGFNTPEKDPDAKYAEAAKGLKESGYTKKDLFEDEKIKAWINENNLNVWILMEYF